LRKHRQIARILPVAAICALATSLAFHYSPARAADTKVDLKGPAQTITPEGQTPRVASIKVDVPLVLVNVTVTDPMNRLVTGLGIEHFEVFEDKEEQEITQFGAEDAPLSMGMVFDASGSMGHKMSKAREAVAQFAKTANPEDEFFLVQFNDRPEMVNNFTHEVEDIQNRLTFTQSKGRTALLDAIYLGINKMKEAKNSKKALLIISDGGDNSSRYTEREIKNLVKEADVQIYAIGIFEPIGFTENLPPETKLMLKRHDEALDLFKQGSRRALSMFEELALYPDQSGYYRYMSTQLKERTAQVADETENARSGAV